MFLQKTITIFTSIGLRYGRTGKTIFTLLNNIQKVNISIAKGFEKVDKNFVIVNDKIDALRGNSTAGIETVENKLTDLTVEISKINEVTSYKGIFNHALRAVK